jgi:putative ABC transport system permease protein
MTVAWLVMKNVFRNRRRTLLTAASVSVSVFPLVILSAPRRYIDAPPGPDRHFLILYVGPCTSLMASLPLTYGERIAAQPGVVAVSPPDGFGVRSGSEATHIASFGCDPRFVFTLYPEWRLPPEQRQAVVNEKLALSPAGYA